MLRREGLRATGCEGLDAQPSAFVTAVLMDVRKQRDIRAKEKGLTVPVPSAENGF
jgi:hypothetical protein